jgi:SAM-dependent methyltransferase
LTHFRNGALNPEEYGIMYRVEDHHWWYRGMANISRAVLDRWYPGSTRLRILDAGCGTGSAAAGFLVEYGQVTGFDIAPIALGYCKLRRLKCLARASAVSIPFCSSHFDLVTSFDVLSDKSVSDDLAALREFHRVLVPGGRVLLRLPAQKWLRGQHDQAVDTSRRYSGREISEMLKSNGFKVQLISYANMLLFPLIVIKRWSERLSQPRIDKSDLTLNMGLLNGPLRAILSWEAPLIARGRLPIGVSLVVLGEKV